MIVCRWVADSSKTALTIPVSLLGLVKTGAGQPSCGGFTDVVRKVNMVLKVNILLRVNMVLKVNGASRARRHASLAKMAPSTGRCVL